MNNYLVNTIYPAFMGECNPYGIGVPCNFIRLAGCNLKCYKDKGGCDTPEAMDFHCGRAMDVDEILLSLLGTPYSVVCVTGGEPLAQDCSELFKGLIGEGYDIVVETNGSVDKVGYYKELIKHNMHISFIVDVKSPSTGMSDKMKEGNYDYMGFRDYLKFVVDTEEDLEFLKMFVHNHPRLHTNIAVGLFWGSKMSYKELMGEIHLLSKESGKPIFLNMQTHKLACMYDKYRNEAGSVYVPKKL